MPVTVKLQAKFLKDKSINAIDENELILEIGQANKGIRRMPWH